MTSTVAVPLVTALGVGLSSSIKGRKPMIDGIRRLYFNMILSELMDSLALAELSYWN